MDENIPGLENLVGNRNHCTNRVTLCPFLDSLQNHWPELSQVHFRAVQPPRVTGEHETAPRHLSQTLHPTCNGKKKNKFFSDGHFIKHLDVITKIKWTLTPTSYDVDELRRIKVLVLLRILDRFFFVCY